MNVKLATNIEESFFSSFFDDPKNTEKPWRRPLKHEESLDPSKILLKASLHKRVKKTNSYQKKFFLFSADFFCMTKVKTIRKALKVVISGYSRTKTQRKSLK